MKAHFRGLSARLADVLERGARAGRFRLAALPEAEAELFMATVHGAMLSARAYDEPAVFGGLSHRFSDDWHPRTSLAAPQGGIYPISLPIRR